LTDIKIKTTSPQAAVLIWNYTDRISQPFGALSSTQDTDSVRIEASSIRSIRTLKTKSTPAGTFQIELAPTHNWISTVTAGSWLVILMTQNKEIKVSGLLGSPAKAQSDEVKMLGRVDSIRLVTTANPETGARQTSYVMTGRDWASIFDCTVYIDTLLGLLLDKQPGAAIATLFGDTISSFGHSKTYSGFFSTTAFVNFIRLTYGTSAANLAQAVDNTQLKTVSMIPDQIFEMPKAVCEYFSIKSGEGLSSKRVGDALTIVSGPLKSLDTGAASDSYRLSHIESVCLPNIAGLIGEHTYWQVLTDHCNPILNEMFAELRWEPAKLLGGLPNPLASAVPKLALYKRIKPFIVDSNKLKAQLVKSATEGDTTALTSSNMVRDLTSEFRHIRRTQIPLEDVVSIDAGTNWRDKVNFAEVLFDDAFIQMYGDTLQSTIKTSSQTLDKLAATREGFRPMRVKTRWFPMPEGITTAGVSIFDTVKWKHMLRAWYFDTHNMLNGAMTIIGQNNFIGVGENVLIPSQALGVQPNFFAGMNLVSDKVFLLAHVESITHSFSVTEDGARSFTSEIQFIRGIFTDSDGNAIPFKTSSGILDPSSNLMVESDRQIKNTTTTETPLLPK